MKRFLLSSLFAGLLFFGCSSENTLVGPVDQDPNSISSTFEEPNWLALPGSSVTRLNKSFSISQLVLANSATSLTINEEYEGGPHGTVDVYAKISFLPGSVDEDVMITMTLDADNAVFDFSPSMVFNKSASLSVKMEGIGLDGVDLAEIDFVYYAPDGSLEYVPHKNLKIDVETGELKVKDIEIAHFSRFGFVR